MAITTNYNRGSECFITATYLTQNGVPYIPTAVQWRLDDVASAAQVVPWTAIVTPTFADTITITSAMNQLLNPAAIVEKKQVTFKVTTPDGNYRYDALVYNLLNLIGAA